METPTRKVLFDYLGTILLAATAALLIRFYVLEAYRIPSFAMRPALLPGDFIFVSKWSYLRKGQHQPGRGEIIVFTQEADGEVDYIKRVIGLPGDTVAVREGVASLNGKALGIAAPNCWMENLPEAKPISVCRESVQSEMEEFPPTRVPEGSVFVIGDLRSQPPREQRHVKSWGVIPLSAIKGEAKWIWLSVEHQPKTRIRWERMFRRIQ